MQFSIVAFNAGNGRKPADVCRENLEQARYPPIGRAAVSPGTFEGAGQQGHPILTSPNFTPVPLIKANFDAYRSALSAGGFDPADYEYPLMQQAYVGRDHDQGYELPREHSVRYHKSLGRLLPKDDDMVSKDYEFSTKVNRNVADLQYDLHYSNGVSFGSSEEVVQRIQHLVDQVGLTYHIGWFDFGGLPHKEVMASMERFATEVVPHFAGMPAAAV